MEVDIFEAIEVIPPLKHRCWKKLQLELFHHELNLATSKVAQNGCTKKLAHLSPVKRSGSLAILIWFLARGNLQKKLYKSSKSMFLRDIIEKFLLFRQSSFPNMLYQMFINLKDCVRYIFASLFFKSKEEHLWNKEKYFLFPFKSSFCLRENQTLEFYIFKFHDVIKCLSMKQEIDFTE